MNNAFRTRGAMDSDPTLAPSLSPSEIWDPSSWLLEKPSQGLQDQFDPLFLSTVSTSEPEDPFGSEFTEQHSSHDLLNPELVEEPTTNQVEIESELVPHSESEITQIIPHDMIDDLLIDPQTQEDPNTSEFHAQSCELYGTLDILPPDKQNVPFLANALFTVNPIHRWSRTRSGLGFYKRAHNVHELAHRFDNAAVIKQFNTWLDGKPDDADCFFRNCLEPTKRLVEVKLGLESIRPRRHQAGLKRGNGTGGCGPSRLGPGSHLRSWWSSVHSDLERWSRCFGLGVAWDSLQIALTIVNVVGFSWTICIRVIGLNVWLAYQTGFNLNLSWFKYKHHLERHAHMDWTLVSCTLRLVSVVLLV